MDNEAEEPKARYVQSINFIELLVAIGAAKSKREARQFIKDGAIQINGRKIKEDDLSNDFIYFQSTYEAFIENKKEILIYNKFDT
jgi:tyrosyl-tRNA synthetase